MAALTIAARRDHYSDFGSASTYQAGLEFRPSKTTLLRASTATSFKPPTLLQTKVDDLRYSTEAFGLVDPARANAPIVGGEVLRTTNRDLTPETGRAWAFGAVWEPESAQGTRLGVTAWRVKIDGLISLLWPQVVLANEARFPGFVTRAPAAPGQVGAVTRVLYAEVNYGGVDTSGLDLEVAHAWKTEGSKWTLSASATRTRDYEVTLAPGAPGREPSGTTCHRLLVTGVEGASVCRHGSWRMEHGTDQPLLGALPRFMAQRASAWRLLASRHGGDFQTGTAGSELGFRQGRLALFVGGQYCQSHA